MKISPSIASCDLSNIKDELIKIGNKYDSLHIDIEDGNFVPNITFGIKTVRAIRTLTDIPFSVHLMVSNPENYLNELFDLNCSHIFIHAESNLYLIRYLRMIRNHNIKAGLALNPISDFNNYKHLINDIDAILYLTSEFDGSGELFQELIIDKINYIPNKECWIDGGINEDTVKFLPYFTNYVVIGRALFKTQDLRNQLNRSIESINIL